MPGDRWRQKYLAINAPGQPTRRRRSVCCNTQVALTFHETQADPVEQARHETRRATALCQEGLRLLSREDGWDTSRASDAFDPFESQKWLLQHPRREKNQGIDEGAMLRRSRHLTMYGQVCQKSADLVHPPIGRMTLGVQQHTSLDPADVCFFRMQTHMLEAHDVSPVVESSCFWLHYALLYPT